MAEQSVGEATAAVAQAAEAQVENRVEAAVEAAEARVEEAEETAQAIADAAVITEIGRQVVAANEGVAKCQTMLMETTQRMENQMAELERKIAAQPQAEPASVVVQSQSTPAVLAASEPAPATVTTIAVVPAENTAVAAVPVAAVKKRRLI